MKPLSVLKKQLIKFIVIGVLAVMVDLACYYILLNLLPEKVFSFIGNEVFAKTISFLCGLSVTYFFNKKWTWKQSGSSKRRFAKFVTLYGFSLVLNVGMNSAFLYILKSNAVFSDLPYKYFIAFIGATGISASMNFLGQKFWVFLVPKTHGYRNNPS